MDSRTWIATSSRSLMGLACASPPAETPTLVGPEAKLDGDVAEALFLCR